MGTRSDMIAKRTQTHRDAAARATDGFVRTPAALADDLVSGHRDIGSLPRGARVLEPSAGDGAIVRAILKNDRDAHVTAVEPNAERVDALHQLADEFPGRVAVYGGTFEQFVEFAEWSRTAGAGSDQSEYGRLFDAVIMNPPFGDSTRAHVWLAHVRAAWDLLHPGALLVSIVPPSYATSGFRAQAEFRTWAEAQGATFVKLTGQPFAESGTGTSAGVLTVPKPMPARADGLPTWLYAPAAGVPVAVRGLPVTTAAGALTTPVQEYDDFADGSRPRVLRYAGTCYGCGRVMWAHDDRGGAASFEACTIDAADHGQTGPSVVACLDHYHGGAETEAAALRQVAPYWTDTPTTTPGDGDGQIVYPLDLGEGSWATVSGVDSRGWKFTMTGRVMADPERVTVPGVAFPAERVAVRLRTARGVDVELYPLDCTHVIMRDVPADVIPAVCDEPVTHGLPQPVTGRLNQPPAPPPERVRIDPGSLVLESRHVELDDPEDPTQYKRLYIVPGAAPGTPVAPTAEVAGPVQGDLFADWAAAARAVGVIA